VGKQILPLEGVKYRPYDNLKLFYKNPDEVLSDANIYGKKNPESLRHIGIIPGSISEENYKKERPVKFFPFRFSPSDPTLFGYVKTTGKDRTIYLNSHLSPLVNKKTGLLESLLSAANTPEHEAGHSIMETPFINGKFEIGSYAKKRGMFDRLANKNFDFHDRLSIRDIKRLYSFLTGNVVKNKSQASKAFDYVDNYLKEFKKIKNNGSPNGIFFDKGIYDKYAIENGILPEVEKFIKQFKKGGLYEKKYYPRGVEKLKQRVLEAMPNMVFNKPKERVTYEA